MSSPYRQIFLPPGTKGFSAAGLLGRLPSAMLSIGVVTMLARVTGRYGLAGAVAATLALSAAALGPRISRLVDRHGQRRVLRPAALCAITAVAALLLCVRGGLPEWTYFVCAACAGCVPSLGSMVRARWAALYRDAPRPLHTAYSWESLLDEVCFVLGPLLSIGLSTRWFPEAGPLAAAVFLAAGVFWLTSQRATEPVPHPTGRRGGGSVLRFPGMPWLALTWGLAGAVFSSVDVVTVAFAEEAGRPALAGPVLAVYALGSGVAAAVFGLLHLRGSPARRWLAGVWAMALGTSPLLIADHLLTLAGVLLLAGTAIAPTAVTTMALVARQVPPARLTEGMAWTGTGVMVGIASGAAVAGWVVDAAGAAAGYRVPVASGLLAAAVASLGYRRLRPAPGRRLQEAGPDAGQHRHHVA
ncbi:MFS transporter [Streptomyces zingiberis]|uniref:MFS transporter n=1 Tax=Streptomyces zingiberis TaxID=2053010 RepID=A0ABX1BW95_9ACTN|nr:MFS transporter [Streptomyces zingiberis]NJQ01981.1 MFS transporter [Streptomyces zingiberis]